MPDQTARDQRLHEHLEGVGDDRTPAQRDRDRILYSTSFRRLAEVTQVVAADSGYVFHNRLTHSLQVAQVGRRLAEKLLKQIGASFPACEHDGLDPDVVESACLAHDLGHPPFGHIAEDKLNELSRKHSCSFEGNAQSFRILNKLAFRSRHYRGLNLTRATLAAVLKYPWLEGNNDKKPQKWGAYLSEEKEFNFARNSYPASKEQSLEAYLMDWADDITYSIHDLEDFFRAGRLPLHLLAARTSPNERLYFFRDVFERRYKENSGVTSRRSDLEEIFTDIMLTYFRAEQTYTGSRDQRASLRDFTGQLIGRYINGIDIAEENGRLTFCVKKDYKDEVFMLKELVWTYVIESPFLATQQWGQKQKIETLFNTYIDAASSPKNWKLFPVYFQERLHEASGNSVETIRVCIDLIAGMTENQVHKVFNRLTGNLSTSDLQDPLQ